MSTHLPFYDEDLKDKDKPYRLYQEGCGCCSDYEYMDLDEAIKYTEETLKEVEEHLQSLITRRTDLLLDKLNKASRAIYEYNKNNPHTYVIQTPYLPEDLK